MQAIQRQPNNILKKSRRCLELDESIANMRKLGLFFRAIFSEWVTALSGPASVPFAILTLCASETVQRTVYGILAACLGFFSAYRVWMKESDQKEAAILETHQIKQEYLSACPQLIMTAVNLSGPPIRGTIGNIPLNVEFSLRHLAGRPATSLTIDPIYSHGGRFTLRLEGLSYVAEDMEQKVGFEVWEKGESPYSKAIQSSGWGKFLRDFLFDNPQGGNPVAFTVLVRFMDRSEFRHQQFLMSFNYSTYRFAVIDWPPEADSDSKVALPLRC